MNNVIFNKGDYNKQISLGQTQDGLIYLNPTNRNITVGTNTEFVNFNTLLVNDNETLNENVNNYTNTSQYINNHYILKNAHSEQYYSIDDARYTIGDTSGSNISNGYISNKLSSLINDTPYEGTLISNLQTTKNNYTIKYPTIINKNFNIVIAFMYNYVNNINTPMEIYVKIYPVLTQADMEVSLDITSNIIPYIYKAFWV